MSRLFAVVALLASTACGGSTSGGAADGGGTESGTASSGGAAADGGADSGPTCVPQNGEYTCLGGTWPVCPSTAQPTQPCDNAVPSCMGCSEGAGFTCSCADAGLVPQQDGSVWNCVGTEYTCQ
jgi:hypothetical protein